ncbi:MAG: ATP-binding protein [Saprospiraceae bacterium]
MKIRNKLSLQFIIITVGIYSLSMLFVYDQFKNHLEAELFNNLESRARMTAEMILLHEDDLKPAPELKDPESIQINDIGNTSIYNKTLTRVYSLIASAPLTPIPALRSIKQAGEFKFVLDPYKAFGYVYTTRKNNEYIVVAEDTPDYSKLVQLKNILFISTLFTTLIVAFGGWFFAGQSLRPVNRIMHEVTDILPNDLSKRLKTDENHDELSQLIITFNLLLDRIENAFKTEKGFISNVSHELKNPLAAIRTQIQYAENKERSTSEYRQILSSLQEDINGMSNTIEKLLQLARVHSNITPLHLTSIRIDEMVYQARESILQANSFYKIKIELKDLPIDEEELFIEGNESLLKLAIMNLMENGCKFSPDQSCITTLDFSSDRSLKLEVKNRGKIIPADDRDKIFNPFYRSPNNSTVKGSGIGLSLVKSITDLHKLDIEVSSNEEDGTLFILHFKKVDLPIYEGDQPTAKAHIPIVSIFLLFLLSILMLTSCSKQKTGTTEENNIKVVIDNWYRQYLDLNQKTDGYRPPVSARTFAYIGLGGWEAAIPKYNQAISFRNQFSELSVPIYTNASYDLSASLNAMYYAFVTLFYPHCNMVLKEVTKKNYETILNNELKLKDSTTVMSSDRFGRSIANAIYDFASLDTIGHLAYLYNYDQSYKIADKPGIWKQTGLQMPALLPHWGKSRTFIPSVLNIKAKPPLPYSESQNSEFFTQAWEIFTISKALSPEKKWIAEFWSDDFHGVTFCSASRWISIALQAIKNTPDMDPLTVLELYVKSGFVLNDAAVLAWGVKYNYLIERPETYIDRIIQPNWKPLHETPSFPAYLSGHSIFGAAVAGVLIHTFGNHVKFTDISHEHRKEFMSEPRTFKSFSDMATENSLSRMYLGVHYRADCEEGLRLGYLISDEVLKLKMRKDESVFNR